MRAFAIIASISFFTAGIIAFAFTLIDECAMQCLEISD